MPELTNRTYISAIEAIGWIALSDFDGIAKIFKKHDTDLWKWKISHKPTLLASFTAIQNGKSWSAQEWLEKSSYCGTELSCSRAEEIIKQIDRPVSELINELSDDIQNDSLATQKVEQAQIDFLEALRAGQVTIYGMEEGGNGNLEIIPTGFLLRDDIEFDLEQNKLYTPAGPLPSLNGLSPQEARSVMLSHTGTSAKDWKNLKISREDVIRLWPMSRDSAPTLPPENTADTNAPGAPSHSRSQLYTTVVEAIIWIARKEWLNYSELLTQCGQEDIFHNSQFSTISTRDRRTDHNSYPYDIGKEEMLCFAERLAEGKAWTQEEWQTSWGRGKTHNADAMQKCLDNECKARGLTLPEFISRLKVSIAYEGEQSKKLHDAEQLLLDAARDGKIAIRGKRKNSTGDIEDVPAGFLDRLDYKVALWGNQFIPVAKAANSQTHQQLAEIRNIGWHELRVKREDVLRLWPERDYFNEMKYAPELAAAKALYARQNIPFELQPAPDWRLWGHIPQMPLWKAIALSLNVDPDALEMYGGFDPDRHRGLSEEFKLRLRVATANLEALGVYINPRSFDRYMPGFLFFVQPTEFAKWATQIGWELPAGFPRAVSNNIAQNGTVSPSPQGTGIKEQEKNNRGRKPVKTTDIKNKILEALVVGETTPESLLSEKQENLAVHYGASREIVVKARDCALTEYQRNTKLPEKDTQVTS